jgi:hypothetical protein
MGMEKGFGDAAGEKPHDYVPDEMKHDFLLLSPAIKNEPRRNIKSDRQKLRKNLRVSFTIIGASRKRRFPLLLAHGDASL